MDTQRKRGFAAMDPERQREIAALGGRTAHQSGHAHQFNSATGKKAAIRSVAKRKDQRLLAQGITADQLPKA